MFSVVGFLYYFYKTWRTDPGYIKTSEKERKEVGDFIETNGMVNLVQRLLLFLCAALLNLKVVKYSWFF